MPRPLRIEYENACYHVMNRGRRRQIIFPDKLYYQAFLLTMEEAHQRFGLRILCYCLMGNHYHLLVKTPEANLGRAMRHVDGVYTQRHNRLLKTDGPLFRGRYKAICVEADSYLLQVSRYIHRNPLEANLVKRLEDYPWSSYLDYLNRRKAPGWLDRQEIYGQLGVASRLAEKYRNFVEQGVDDEMVDFYSRDTPPYLGSDAFRDWVYRQRTTDEEAVSYQVRSCFRPGSEEIVSQVARTFNVSTESILQTRRGRMENNIPRWVALYLCRECGGLKLKEIAEQFGLKRTGSIPTTINKLLALTRHQPRLLKTVNRLKRQYDT